MFTTAAANATIKVPAAIVFLQSFQRNAIEWLAANWLDVPVALLIFFIGKWIARVISGLLHRLLERQRFDSMLVGFLSKTLYFGLLMAVIIAATSQLGFNVASLVAMFGAVALAVGLAMKDSLSNFASGVMLAMFRPFTVGDYIDTAGTAGTVERVNIFYTELKSPDNKQIYVPNSKIMNAIITNVTAKPIRRMDMVFGIGYGDDIDQARKVFESLLQDPRVLKDPAPVIAVHELADSSVNFVVRPWVKKADYWDVYWALTENAKKELDKAGISIPFPQQDVHLFKEGGE